jgi:hypothetical protein
MNELPRLGDLVAGAITAHGTATADLLRRLDQGEKVDLVGETVECLGNLTGTGARFLMFWDNIATLLAADGEGPLTFPAPKLCADGEIQSLRLRVEGTTSARVESGLRRRGDGGTSIGAQSITLQVDNGVLVLEVDCSGVPRGLYEGSVSLVDAGGTRTMRTYNLYIDPARPS